MAGWCGRGDTAARRAGNCPGATLPIIGRIVGALSKKSDRPQAEAPEQDTAEQFQFVILLDTSAAVELLRGRQPPETILDQAIGLSVVVEMELHLGVLHGGGRKEKDAVDAFLRSVKIFEWDSHAALVSARVISRLWKEGRPIGDFDAQIAGHAIALDMPLLSCNGKHFKRVKELHHLDWPS